MTRCCQWTRTGAGPNRAGRHQRHPTDKPPTSGSSFPTKHNRINCYDLNAHKNKLGKDVSPKCRCGVQRENTDNFLLSCPLFSTERAELFQCTSTILNSDLIISKKLKQKNCYMDPPQNAEFHLQPIPSSEQIRANFTTSRHVNAARGSGSGASIRRGSTIC